MKRASCVTILFLVSCASIAGMPLAFSEQGWDSMEKKFGQGWNDDSMEKGIINESYLLLSGVVIETTTLDEVIHIFGQSEVYRPDENKHSPNLLCYKSENDNTSVIFEAGFLGGYEIVTSFFR